MNAAQKNKLLSLTNRLNRNYTCDDNRMAFSVTPIGNSRTVLFAATNVYANRWFDSIRDFYAYIGPRGGVKKYHGSLDIK